MASAQEKIYTVDDYDALPEDVRAELIDGQIYYLAAPGRLHQKVLNILNNTVYNYIQKKGGDCEVYPAPFAVRLFEDNRTVVEPDLSIICDKNKLTERGCNGAPDWIIEIISPGNPWNDYVTKLRLYLEAGVREYWIVNPKNGTVLVYFFEQEAFDVRPYTFQDKIPVGIYGDLVIDFAEISL